MAIIYLIENNVNSCKYVGQTNSSLANRMKNHKANLNGGNTTLYKAMRELGFENFTITPLEYLDEEQSIVDDRELYWINYYAEKFPLYNMKYSKGKCGGDTLSNHPDLMKIKSTISKKVSGGKNSHATKVIAVEISTGKETIYNSFSECQKALDIPRHCIIGRRCRGIIKKPYNGYMFKYVD